MRILSNVFVLFCLPFHIAVFLFLDLSPRFFICANANLGTIGKFMDCTNNEIFFFVRLIKNIQSDNNIQTNPKFQNKR